MKPRNLICLITDRRRLSPESPDERSFDRLVELVSAAGRAGVDLIQLREPDLESGTLETLAERCVQAARGTPVLVNDRLDVALAAGAAGVHLRGDSVAGTVVRAAVPDGFLVGRSVHGREEAAAAAGGGALDYLVFGTVFETSSKQAGHSAAGTYALAEVCAAVTVPVLAVGGITVDRAQESSQDRLL